MQYTGTLTLSVIALATPDATATNEMEEAPASSKALASASTSIKASAISAWTAYPPITPSFCGKSNVRLDYHPRISNALDLGGHLLAPFTLYSINTGFLN